MREFLKKQKNRRNSAGFTLVEVLVAVAILGVAVTAIGGFLVSGIRSYSSTSAEAKLQNEAQMALNQIEDIVIDAGLGVSYNVVTANGDHFVQNDGEAPTGEAVTAKYLYVFNWNDARNKVQALLIKYDPVEQKLYYYECEVDNATGTDGASLTIAMAMDVTAVTDWSLLAEGVTSFSINMSNYQTTKQITVSLSLEKRTKTYATSANVTLRNNVLINAERIAEIYERVDVVEITTINGIELRTSSNSTMKGGNIQLSTKVTGTGYPSQSIYQWTVEAVTGGTLGKDADGFITISDEVVADGLLFDSRDERGTSYPVTIDTATKVLNVSTACTATTLKVTAYCYGKDAEGKYLSASRYINVKSISQVTLQPIPDFDLPENSTMDKTKNTFEAASYSVAIDQRLDASTDPLKYSITGYPGNIIHFEGKVIGEGNTLDADDQRLTWEIKNVTNGVSVEREGTDIKIGRYSQQGSFIVEITPILNTNIKLQYLVNVGTQYDSNNNALKIKNAGNVNRGGSRALTLTMNEFDVDVLSDYDWSIEAITADSGVKLTPGADTATISGDGVVSVASTLAFGLSYQISVKASMKSNPDIMATTVVTVPVVKLELTNETIQSSKGAVIFSLNDNSTEARYYRANGGEALQCVVTGIENYDLVWKVSTETNANAFAAITPNKSVITGDTGIDTAGSRVNSATLSISSSEVVQEMYVKVALSTDASFNDSLYVTLYGNSDQNKVAFTGLAAVPTAIYRGESTKIVPTGTGSGFKATDVSDWKIVSPATDKTGLTLNQNADGSATLAVADSFQSAATNDVNVQISAKYRDGQTQTVTIKVYKEPGLNAVFKFYNDRNKEVSSIMRAQELKIVMSGVNFDADTANWRITGLKYQNNVDRGFCHIVRESSKVAYICITNFEFDMQNHDDNEIYFTLEGKVRGETKTLYGSISVSPVGISITSGPKVKTKGNKVTYTYTAEVSGIYSGKNFNKTIGEMDDAVEHNISIVWRIRENVVNSQLVTEYENPVESAKWKLELSDEKEDLKSTGKVKLTDKNLVTQEKTFQIAATVGVRGKGDYEHGTTFGTNFTVQGSSIDDQLKNPKEEISGFKDKNFNYSEVEIGGTLQKPDKCKEGHAQYYALYEQQQISGDSAKYYQVKFKSHKKDDFDKDDHFKNDKKFSYYAYFNSQWYEWGEDGWTAVSDTELFFDDTRNGIMLKDALNKLPH